MPLNNRTAQQLAYYEVVPAAESSQVNFDTWEDWDLSAVVPTGAKFVEVFMRRINAANNIGVRNKGSALNHFFPLELAHAMVMTCAVTGQEIQRYSGTNVAQAKFSVLGYWM